MTMQTSDADWLCGDNAAATLYQLHTAPTPTPAVVAGLRKRFSPGQTHLLLEQAELRIRAQKKFKLADRMLFTRKAYEQATDEEIARYKASRFARFGVVVDACCGIGGDLIGLAGVVEQAIGVDADGAVSAFARHNLKAYGLTADIKSIALNADTLPACSAWHADPDRRVAGRRSTTPELHEPNLETLARWRERTDAGAVKLAPATRLPDGWQRSAELEWISRHGECRQLVAWSGALSRRAGQRRATRLVTNQPAATFVGLPGVIPPAAASLGQWIHEPDPAVLAADLTGALAEHHRLAAVAPPLPYLTGEGPINDSLIASFRVIEAMPLDRKRLAAWLAERGIGRLEIKCRGAELLPETLRRELKPRGEMEATLLVFPNHQGKTRVVIARRPDAA